MLYNSRLYSVFVNKYPRCHEGDFFVAGRSWLTFFMKPDLHKYRAEAETP